jgi:hypothetical protein
MDGLYFIICSTVNCSFITDRLRGYLTNVRDPLSEARNDMMDTLLKSNLFL